MLDIKNLSVEKNGKKILSEICFSVEKGKHTVLLGKNGSGKTTLLNCINGTCGYCGEISLSQRPLEDFSLRERGKKIGYMPQLLSSPHITVSELVSMGRTPHIGLGGRAAEADREMVAEAIHSAGLDGLKDAYLDRISGGELQRAYLALVLAQDAELILLDEPFSALDGYLRDRMQVEMSEMLEDYSGQVVMVSHSRDELYRFSEELFIVSHGSIIRHGETKAVFSEPESTIAARLTGCKNFSKARQIDEHTIEAPDWGVTLRLKREVPENTSFVGFRAHSFEPVWGERQENCIKCDVIRVDDLPFEKNYYIRGLKDEDPLCWFVQGEEQRVIEERGLPDYLKLSEDDILLLE